MRLHVVISFLAADLANELGISNTAGDQPLADRLQQTDPRTSHIREEAEPESLPVSRLPTPARFIRWFSSPCINGSLSFCINAWLPVFCLVAI
jgi:hypothetical protein